MQSFTTKLVRVAELTGVIDSIAPKDLGTMKDIRLATGLVKDLQEASKEYFEKMTSVQLAQMAIVKPFQDQYKEQIVGKTEEEVKMITAKLDAELKAALAKYEEDHKDDMKAFDEFGLKEVTVELGDEKFAKLKELFEKFGADKYLKKDACVEMADALKI